MVTNLLQARVLEQIEAWTPWDRRVWHTGTVLALQELVEASSWSVRGVLSDSAVQWLRSSLLPELGRDQGLANPATRAQLEAILKQPLNYASQRRRQLERITEYVAEHYLDGWLEAARKGSVHLERGSRYMASYALDLGFHPEYLRKVLRTHSGNSEEDLIEELRGLAARPTTAFTGWVLLSDVPERELMEQRSSWIDPTEVARLMRSIGEQPPRNQSGGLWFEVCARDEIAAAEQVRSQLERLLSRTRFLRVSKPLSYDPKWWREKGKPISLRARGPAINAMSLAKSGLLYEDRLAGDAHGRIDDAFELASHLIGSPAPVAVSNAWAALESLLIDPGESDQSVGGKVIVATRAAKMLATAWPRAEFTRMSYRLLKSPSLDLKIRSGLDEIGDDNVRRCALLLQHWDQIENTADLSLEDQAAVQRIAQLKQNPQAVLGRVEGYMAGALRRLYRHRNLVMHGGELRPVALSATIRTTGPLVGALLDRLAVAAHLRREDPLHAIARTEVALQSIKSTKDLTFLLEM